MKRLLSGLLIIFVGLISTFNIVKANSYTNVTSLIDIPNVDGALSDANDLTKVGRVKFNIRPAGHSLEVKHPNGTTYILATSGGTPITLSLPGLTGNSELRLDSGVLFKGSDGNQLLYYELQNPSSTSRENINIFDDDDAVYNGFRPYVIWDFEHGVYDLTDKLTTYAVFHAGSYKRAYADILFNLDFDDVLWVELLWEYRYQNILGGWTQWKYDSAIRYKDETVIATSFWNDYKNSLKYFWTLKWKNITDLSRFSQTTLERLTPTASYRSDYVGKLNTKLSKEDKPLVSTASLFGDEYSLYRVYLNTYGAGLYTDYEISDDIVLIDIAYIYKGEYFHPRIEDITWESVGGRGSENDGGALQDVANFFDRFRSFLKRLFGDYSRVAEIAIIIIIVIFILRIVRWFTDPFRRY